MRLRGYNYARAGAYYITINCKHRIPFLGEIINKKMILSDFGIIAQKEWMRTPQVRPNIALGPFVIMPDHIHGIIIIKKDLSGKNENLNEVVLLTPQIFSSDPPRLLSSDFSRPSSFDSPRRYSTFHSPSQTLGAIVRGYMGTVTSQINKLRNTPDEKVWQRNYHDHIIRNKWDYHRVSRYIRNNPRKWKDEKKGNL